MKKSEEIMALLDPEGVKKRFVGIRQRVLILAGLGTIFVTAVTAVLFTQYSTALIKEGAYHHVDAVGRSFAINSELGFLTNDEDALQKTISNVEREKDILFAFVTDSQGLMVSSHSTNLPKGFIGKLPGIIKGEIELTPDLFEAFLERPKLGHFMKYPIHPWHQSIGDGVARAALNNQPLGYACLIYSDMRAHVEVRSLQVKIFIIAFILASIILIMVFSLTSLLVNRINALFSGTEEIRKGNLSFRVDIDSNDELGVLGGAFNLMAKELQKTTVTRDALVNVIEDLKEAEEELDRFFNLSVDLFCIAGFDGYFKRLNPMWQKVLGYSREEMMSKPFIEFIHPDDVEETKKQIAGLTSGQQTEIVGFEHRYRAKDGTYKRFVWTAVSLPQSGLMYATARDITNVKQLEAELQQAQKMEAIGRLAGGIAHDFNNQLMVIVGYSDYLLAKMTDEDPKKEGVMEIKQAAERSSVLTQQLLAFSRRQIVKAQVINPNELISGLDNMFRRLIGEDIDFISSPGNDVDLIKVDQGQMSQVLANLVVNARDAMPKGGRIMLETKNQKLSKQEAQSLGDLKAGDYVVLSVADNGQGIPDEVKEHIFEPFFTTKGKEKGTGLGLATSFGIIKQNGGHIDVQSEVGRGTVFNIYLPKSNESLEKKETTGNKLELPRGSETVLLTEDESAVRKLAASVLREQGYKVIEANNGHNAIEIAKDQADEEIDLLVTDVIMPKMGGRELSEQIQALRPDVKVLFMSGYTDDEVVRRGVVEAHFNYIQKPFTTDVLVHKVRQVLDEED